MAVLDVVKAGHPVLKQIAEPVEHVNKKLRALSMIWLRQCMKPRRWTCCTSSSCI